MALAPGRVAVSARVLVSSRSRAVPGALPGPLVTVEKSEIVIWRDATEFESTNMLVAPLDKLVKRGLRARLQIGTPLAVPVWVIQWRGLPPSQNEIMRRFRTPHAYDRLLAGWRDVFRAAATTIPKATGRRRIEITRFIRDKNYRLDRGNLVGGCKPVLDAAVHAGLLLDDREDHLDDHYDQRIDPVERVRIAISDLPDFG